MTQSLLAKLTQSLNSDEIDQAIVLAQSHSLSPTDPIWHFLEKLNLSKQEYQDKIAEIDRDRAEFKEEILPMIDQMKTACDIEVAGLKAQISNLQAQKQEPQKRRGKPPRPSNLPHQVQVGLPVAVGLLIGIAGSGVFAYFFIIPQQIAEQRTQDKSTLEFLDTSEGKKFRQMIEVNKNYFPDKCQKEAKRQGVFLTVNKKRTNQVCVLLIP
jgi:hypothetical protein